MNERKKKKNQKSNEHAKIIPSDPKLKSQPRPQGKS